MNASIASPWHRARTPVGNGRNRCNVCQPYLGRHERAWTAAACGADNEVFWSGGSSQASALSRAPGFNGDQPAFETHECFLFPVTVRGFVILRQTFVRRCHGGIVKKNRRVYKPRLV